MSNKVIRALAHIISHHAHFEDAYKQFKQSFMAMQQTVNDVHNAYEVLDSVLKQNTAQIQTAIENLEDATTEAGKAFEAFEQALHDLE